MSSLFAALLAAAALAGCTGSNNPMGDAGLDAVAHCTEPMQTSCSGRCVNMTSDRLNCGSCGHACGGGEVCVAGACQASCPGTEIACGGLCVETQTDVANCGACGNACAAGQVCAMGTCRTDCGSALMTCTGANGDAGVADGGDGRYCANTHSDRNNCGACHMACGMGLLCVSGSCQSSCPSANTVCSGTCVDTHSDPLHCGSCTTACTAGQVCQDGECLNTGPCPLGQFMCGANCVDTQTDVANCGACSHACPAGQDCVTGTCSRTCAGGQMLCGTACVDVTHDPMHCGSCTTACPSGQVCTAGHCGIECPTGQTLCGGVCVDVTGDAANCGGCGMACPAGQLCNGGSCALTCGAGQMLCSGSCANTGVDPANCGSCGNACAAGQACRGGACQTIEMVDSGCAPPSLFCGSVCASVQNDNANCGTCGRACTADRTCVAGMCVAPCAAGQIRCGGTCTNIQSDPANCSACGMACGTGQVCVSGACQMAVRVAVLRGGSNVDLQTKLQAVRIGGTNPFTVVDFININTTTPTLTQLQAYDAVAVYTYLSVPAAVSTNLVAYLEAGGGVVYFDSENQETSSYAFPAPYQGTYNILPQISASSFNTSDVTLGVVSVPTSPLMAGVTTMHLPSGGYGHIPSSYMPRAGATVIASWSDGAPAVMEATINGHRVVELNMFGGSRDDASDGWDAASDVARLIANALIYQASAP